MDGWALVSKLILMTATPNQQERSLEPFSKRALPVNTIIYLRSSSNSSMPGEVQELPLPGVDGFEPLVPLLSPTPPSPTPLSSLTVSLSRCAYTFQVRQTALVCLQVLAVVALVALNSAGIPDWPQIQWSSSWVSTGLLQCICLFMSRTCDMFKANIGIFVCSTDFFLLSPYTVFQYCLWEKERDLNMEFWWDSLVSWVLLKTSLRKLAHSNGFYCSQS